MGQNLKLTLQTGEELEIPFDASSVLTVTTIATVEGVQTEKAEAHTDIVGVELVDAPDVEQPELVQMTGEQAAAVDAQVPIGGDPAPQSAGVAQEPPAGEEPTGDEAVSHDDAVSAAQAAVEASSNGWPQEHVRQAIADVDAALELYPESAELQDAKQQLGLFVTGA